MIALLTLSNTKSVVALMLAILGFAIVFSYLVVTLMKHVTDKEKRKAMATPIETAKNMGLNIVPSDKYEEKNEILVTVRTMLSSLNITHRILNITHLSMKEKAVNIRCL